MRGITALKLLRARVCRVASAFRMLINVQKSNIDFNTEEEMAFKHTNWCCSTYDGICTFEHVIIQVACAKDCKTSLPTEGHATACGRHIHL